MKTMFIVTTLLAGSMLMAKSTQRLRPDQFAKKVQADIGASTNGHSFEGELEDVGGDCTVSLARDSQGRTQILLQSQGGLKLALPLRNDDVARLDVNESEDGSYEHTYSYGYQGVYKVTVVHSDDAYDYIKLSNGSTSLTCGVWY